MKKQGKFIVVDGCEGAGKTTLLKLAAREFRKGKILITHEPGGTVLADKLRKLILSKDIAKASAETMFALLWAARADHMKNKIIPALESGVTVISDRFDSSTYAYQIYGAEAFHLESLFFTVREAFLGSYEPDLYIFLDVDPSVGLSRLKWRKEVLTHFERRTLDFHERVREGYLNFFAKDFPHKVLDANRDIKEVAADFISILKAAVA